MLNRLEKCRYIIWNPVKMGLLTFHQQFSLVIWSFTLRLEKQPRKMTPSKY